VIEGEDDVREGEMLSHRRARVRGARRRAAWAAVALALAVGSTSAIPAVRAASKWEWDGVDRVVGIGDVHGRYDELTAILQGAGLTDDQLRWTGGDDHLVLCGDLVDRGEQDRPVLELAMRLQKEAESAGGRVHVVLGNHEVMNLTRDFRYVHPGGYADFEPQENAGDRKRAWEKYEKALSGKGANATELREGFDERYPPGYFARRRAFSEKGDYGSWLLGQPSVIRVNGILFVHGGLTPEVAALGIDEINERVRKSIRAFMESASVLEGVMTTPGSFAELHGTAQQLMQLFSRGRSVDRDLVRAATVLLDQIDELAFAPDGPQWYRGSSLDNERLERARVRKVFEHLSAHAIMVGHTVTRTGRVSSRLNGHVIRGDVGMGYGRRGLAVVFEKGEVSILDPATRTASLPFIEPPFGEGWTGGSVNMADAELEKFLGEARIVKRTEVSPQGQRAELWDLEGEGLKLRGVFKDIDEEQPAAGRTSARRYEHEVAAYELDRMLDLGLVPVVVLREEDGRRGALRVLLETALDLVSIRSYQGLQGAGPEETIKAVAASYGIGSEELRQQVVGARVFDGLIGNQEREDPDKLFVPAEGRVSLVDHEQAFSLSADLDPDLLYPCRPMPADLRTQLMTLSRDKLETSLGDYLSDTQIDAMLKRRDRVLELCGDVR
jgi:hypothetical protein